MLGVMMTYVKTSVLQLALACSYTSRLIIRVIGLRQTGPMGPMGPMAGASTVAHFTALGNE